jgi:hypothetical protein
MEDVVVVCLELMICLGGSGLESEDFFMKI